MGKLLNCGARILMNKMNLQPNELPYPCLTFNWAASGIILAVAGDNHPGKFCGHCIGKNVQIV